MVYIKNNSDFRMWYGILRFLTANPRAFAGSARKTRKMIVEVKRGLRSFSHAIPDQASRVIKDNGVDGFVALERLPDDITDEAEANSFFEDFMTFHCRPSAYDCTGQAFTNWFKVFQRGGRFYAYHSVSFDV